MRLFKRGKIWYLDYHYPPGRRGKRIRLKVGPNKHEAQVKLAEVQKDLWQGRNPELRRIDPKPFDAMVKEFLEKHAARARDPESFKHNTEILKRYFSGKTLQEIGPKQIETFIAGRLASKVSKATVNRQRATLSKIFNCARDWGYFGGENPVRQVKRFPESPGRTRFLTAKEAEALIEASSDHLRPVVICAMRTGGRLSELLSLRWEDVDLARGVLYFVQSNTKSGKQREIPIDPVLNQVLQERRKKVFLGGDAATFVFTRFGRRLRDLRTAFEKAKERAKTRSEGKVKLGEEVGFHTLRHTFASWFMMNGGDIFRLQKYLGHSTIALTQRYAHLSPDYVRDGARFFGPPVQVVDPKMAQTGLTGGHQIP